MPDTIPISSESVRSALLGNRLSIPELATALDVSERTIQRLITQGLPYVKLAGKRYVSPEDFRAMLERSECNVRRPGRR